MISIEILTKHVAAAKQQDREAFIFLFNHTKDYIYSVAYSLTQDTQEAQDIVQEVYLRVWMHLSDLHEDRSFLRWIHSITFNISQDHLRQRLQEQNALASAAEDLVLQKTSFDEWFLRSWKQEIIRDMVQALPEEQRDAIYLFYFQDRTVGEIAAIQNCSINTVKSRLYYARNTLQKLIEAEEKKTGELRLSPAVIAMTSVMMLPMVPISLPHAESIRILMAVFAAAESMNGGISFAQVYDEQETAAAQGFLRQIMSAIEKHWIIRIHSNTVIVLLAMVILLAFGFVFIGRVLERQTSISGVYPSAQTTMVDNAEAVPTPANPVEEFTPTAPKILAQGQCGDTAQFTVTDDGVLRITGKGRIGLEETWRWTALLNGEDQSLFSMEELDPYRDFVKEIIVEDGITEIGYAAFARANIESISLPDSCTRVAAGSLFACASLKEFVFPPHVVDIEDCVLKDCISLKKLVVSEDAVYIGSEAFSGCFELQEIEFRGNALKKIGGAAFNQLSSLKTLQLPDSVERIMSGAISHCSIEMLDLSGLKNPVIDGSAIRDCNELRTVLMPEHMDRIRTTTIYNCPNLTTVVLGTDTKSIDQKAFHNAALTEITIPASVVSIASGAFAGNRNLAAIRVDDANPHYCDVDGVLFHRSMDTIHTYPSHRAETSYILPESVRTIGNQAFAYNKSLITLVIPGDVTVLEKQGVYQLPSLTGIYFQSSLPQIWAVNAITGCNKLTLYVSKPTDGMVDGTWTAPDGTVYPMEIIKNPES